MWTYPGFPSCLIKLNNSYVLLCYILWNETLWKAWSLGVVRTHLLTHQLRHTLCENGINFCEQTIVAFSRELVFIGPCIMLKSYNFGDYLFHKLFTHSSLMILFSHWWTSSFFRFFFPSETTISTESIFWLRKTERLFEKCLFWK